MNSTTCAVCGAPADTWHDKTERLQFIDCTGGCGKHKMTGDAEAILRVASLPRDVVARLQDAVLNSPGTTINGDFIAYVLRAEERHG